MAETFLDIQKEAMEVHGFWTENYRSTLILQAELMFKNEVLREWHITDMVMNGDKVLFKWNKRIFPLADHELKEKYGR